MENQSTSMEFLLLEEVQFLEVKDDALWQWEIVNVLDTEEGGEKCDDGDSVQSGFGSWDSSIPCSVSPNDEPIEGIYCRLFHPDVDVKDEGDVDVDSNCYRHFDVYGEKPVHEFHDADEDGYGGGQDEDDDDDDDDGFDLDDELIPWSVSGKFGRQRMRKLGKRAFPKMHNSKRSPYLFLRPGCVRGKHGLGLKHNY